ncbi:MAG: HDIG domain-containing metalloprotein [Candidatus Bathyarchaeia archaeon]
MNKQLPNREQAIEILQKNGCSAKVIAHCQAVASLALELAEKLKKKNIPVDLALVEAGALLHDLGRSKTHSVNHAVEGAELARAEGLPEEVICIIKRHVGAGITDEEAQWLGWPKDNYVPQSMEEKIVCYADKCIGSNERIPVEATIKQLHEQKLDGAAERVRKLHDEITHYLEA